MWTFITQPGVATVVLDFTDDFSLLIVGLLTVVWLSAAMIVWASLSDHRAQQPTAVHDTKPAPVEDREAA